MPERSALVVGATGITGLSLAQHLVDGGWRVGGLARNPRSDLPGVRPVAADLLDPASLAKALADVRPSHVFITTWLRQATEAENIRVNSAMVRNLLDALRANGSQLQHVALATGLKHYLGPFEAYGKGTLPGTPFREEQARLPIANFYYAQEDEVFAAAKKDGFSWSVHRPHTIIGYAVGNAMNMGTTLAVYATLCKATGRTFLFPGSAAQWNGLVDMTDARLLAKHLTWAATAESAKDQAFNVVNGDVFRWKWMWPKLAEYFGLTAAEYPGHATPLDEQMKDAAPEWTKLATDRGLVEKDMSRLVSWWHTDADLGRPIEVIADMTKSRKAGFLDYQSTPDSFVDLFERLKAERLI